MKRSSTRLLPVKLLGALLVLTGAAPGRVPLAGQVSEGVATGMGLRLRRVGNGFGPLLPHRIHLLDGAGNPTQTVVEIRTLDVLVQNATPANPVLPNAGFPSAALLPNGSAGNHYLVASFTGAIDVDTVLDSSPAGQASGGLLGSITVVAVDPASGQVAPVPGRAFVAGRTYAGTPAGSPPTLPLQRWVSLRAGQLVANPAIDNDGDGAPDGLGFPGTEGGGPFRDARALASRGSFVFVPDSDGDLRTHETFPPGRQIVLRLTTAVRDNAGEALAEPGVAVATVGPDQVAPAVASSPLTFGPDIQPGNGDVDVDPATSVRVRFTESMQPLSVGSFPGAGAPVLSGAVLLTFGPPSQVVTVPFTALPVGPLDLTSFELTPAFAFPGTGPDPLGCASFGTIRVDVTAGGAADLAGNGNLLDVATTFQTGEGPALVNAPVAPEALYVARQGALPAVSVLDLNGFGQSTGDPSGSNFLNNPNLLFQGSILTPPLQPGTCTTDGGSAGVFTLTADSSLDDRLLRAPLVSSVGDMMIGQPLERVFHAGTEPGGCQSGGGNLCAITGKKLVEVAISTSGSLQPPSPGQFPLFTVLAGANPISWAPTPNPPALTFTPLCVSPSLLVAEPTSTDSSGFANLLVPGDPFGNPGVGLPPSGLLSPVQNGFFIGPSAPQPLLSLCAEYGMRQQVGHFLYVVDRVRREVVVVNSNRMLVLDRIELPDPTSLAMSPELDFLAVTNATVGTVSFVDVDPTSATFHEVVTTVSVGAGPRGIAWEPGNEDILVCNELDGTLSVISAFSLSVRKTVAGALTQPFEVAITPRQLGLGFNRGVYFAYVLNRNGEVAVFESGPGGVNGWGFDDVLGVVPITFQSPKAIQPDPRELRSAVWIAHEGVAGSGALSRLVLDTATQGQIPLQPGQTPQFRSMTYAVDVALDATQLTGVPVDLAFDDLYNLGALPNVHTPFSAGNPAVLNGKGLVRAPLGARIPASQPSYLFLTVPVSTEGPGVIDVVDLETATRFDTDVAQPGVQSIPASGAACITGYFRQ